MRWEEEKREESVSYGKRKLVSRSTVRKGEGWRGGGKRGLCGEEIVTGQGYGEVYRETFRSRSPSLMKSIRHCSLIIIPSLSFPHEIY